MGCPATHISDYSNDRDYNAADIRDREDDNERVSEAGTDDESVDY